MEKIIIIGAGPAGISAALYAARANMDPLVINNGIGALEKAEKIENYYGMEHPVSGKELFFPYTSESPAFLMIPIISTYCYLPCNCSVSSQLPHSLKGTC